MHHTTLGSLTTFSILSSRDGHSSPRTEILHNIDPTVPLFGEMLYPDTFDTRIQAAIRVGDWKLMTGDHRTEGEYRYRELETDEDEERHQGSK